MKIFKNIKDSIYGPEYYKEVLAKPASYSFKYYFLFALIVSLVITVCFSFMAIPKIKAFADYGSTKIVELFPAELRIDVKNGQVSTNVQEPYFIKFPGELKAKENSEISNKNLSNIENILVIDTKNDFNLDTFNSYKTFALLTKNSVVYYKDNGIEMQPLESSMNFSVDREKVASVIDKIKPYIKFVYPIVVLSIFVISMIVFCFQLICLFFGALFVWLVARLKKVNMGYLKAYQLSLHLLTFGILVETLAFLFGYVIPIPFFGTILLAIFAAINLKS